jgi:hypothetical protein
MVVKTFIRNLRDAIRHTNAPFFLNNHSRSEPDGQGRYKLTLILSGLPEGEPTPRLRQRQLRFEDLVESLSQTELTFKLAQAEHLAHQAMELAKAVGSDWRPQILSIQQKSPDLAKTLEDDWPYVVLAIEWSERAYNATFRCFSLKGLKNRIRSRRLNDAASEAHKAAADRWYFRRSYPGFEQSRDIELLHRRVEKIHAEIANDFYKRITAVFRKRRRYGPF